MLLVICLNSDSKFIFYSTSGPHYFNSFSNTHSSSCLFALTEIICSNPHHRLLHKLTYTCSSFSMFLQSQVIYYKRLTHVCSLEEVYMLISLSWSIWYDYHPWCCLLLLWKRACVWLTGRQPVGLCVVCIFACMSAPTKYILGMFWHVLSRTICGFVI